MLKSKVNRLTSSMIAGLVLALPAANVTADTFSAGGGWPFILAPTITLKQGNNIEYYANYKLGLDDGFTAGVQWAEGHFITCARTSRSSVGRPTCWQERRLEHLHGGGDALHEA